MLIWLLAGRRHLTRDSSSGPRKKSVKRKIRYHVVAGRRRLTRGSRVSVVSLVISIPGRKSFFYRKTGNFYRKNDQEKISEIFVHVDPEKT